MEQTEQACSIGGGDACGCGGGSGSGRGFSLSSCSRKERVALIAATAVVIGGIAGAALNPARLDAAPKVAAAAPADHAACASTPTVAATVPAAPVAAVVATPAASSSASSAGTVTRTTTRRTTSTRQVTRQPARRTNPAPSPAATTPTSRGLVVSFGSYDGAPLKWRVLSESDDELLLLAEHVVTAGAFQSDWEGADANSYGTSEVHSWLTGTFSSAAFSAEESAALLPHVGGGVAGSDTVFLLNAAELNRYLPSLASRKAAPSASGAAKIGYSGETLSLTSGYSAWWLADSGSDTTSAKYVRADGTVASQLVYYGDLGVRPAIRVDRDKVALALAGQGAD